MVTVPSVDANGWTTLRGYLDDGMVVLAQELFRRGEAVQGALAKAKMGWRRRHIAAGSGPKGDASGGVGIFVRGEDGLRNWPSAKALGCAGNRLLAASVDAPGFGPILGLVAYMIAGLGVGRPIVQLLGKAGEDTQQRGGSAILTGDSNGCPQQPRGTGFPAKLQHRAGMGPHGKPTCRPVDAASGPDFLVRTRGLARMARRPRVRKGSSYPHSPGRLVSGDGRAEVQEPHLSPADGGPLVPRPTMAGLRRASSTSPKRMAATADGAHQRHSPMMSNEAWDVTRPLIDDMDEASRAPEKAWLVMRLTPKSPGKAGCRPFGLVVGLWRV